jgi:aspartate aminotransferase-like enzyme
VPLLPAVRAALARPPQAHRWPEALARLQRVRELLRARTGARHVAVMTGSGTTANDVVAAQLALRRGPGLVLAAGEFGERLVDAARRTGLDVRVLRAPEGSAVTGEQLAAALAQQPADWVWTVHCETSTGVLFDLPGLVAACRAAGAELAVDAISSLGCAPVDLSDVLLATASSGKALAGFPGLAVVLAREATPAGQDLPRSLDLHAYTSGDGLPYTLPTTLVGGLLAALGLRPAEDEPAALAELAVTSAQLRRELGARGLQVVAQEQCAAPAVLSVRLPAGVDPAALADRVAADGFLLAGHSGYLRDLGWVQISLMGRPSTHDLEGLPAATASWPRATPTPASTRATPASSSSATGRSRATPSASGTRARRRSHARRRRSCGRCTADPHATPA